MKKNTLPALTSLRFFAAMAIIAFHFSINNAAMIPSFLYSIVKQGNLAVNFFFVLSGFVLAYNYLDKPVDAQRFWIARFARVYPVYLLALLLSVPAYLTTVAATADYPLGLTVTSLFAELTLLQAWFPINQCGGINCPGWSISAEAFFYLTFPFLGVYLAKVATRRALFAASFIWVIAIAINVPLWLIYTEMSDTAAKTVFGNIISFNPLLNLSAFVVGLAAGLAFLRRRPVTATAKPHQSTLLEIGALLLALIVIAYSGIPSALLRTGIASPLFALIIYTLALGDGYIARLLSYRFLLVLGEASYAIYILQVPLSDWTRKLIAVTPLQHWNTIAYPALYLPIIIGGSVVSFYLLEKPIRKKIIALLQSKAATTTKPLLAATR
jgi:peptidoglycan/LPS O-acetylase OafA/YrhL